MTIEKEDTGVHQPRTILVAVRFDNDGKDLLRWALAKVADPQDHVVAVHVSRYPEDADKAKLLLDDNLEIYRGLCDIKKVKLTGKILIGKSIKKSVVRDAKDCGAVCVIVGASNGSIGNWVSTAKYCAKHLGPTTQVLSVHNGKLVFKRRPLDPPPPPPPPPPPLPEGDLHIMKMKSERFEIGSNKSRSESDRPGWPLLRRASFPTQRALECRKMSVVQWVMSLPDRHRHRSPTPDTPESTSTTTDSERESPLSRNSSASSSAWSDLMLEDSALPFDSDFTWFSYQVLNHATSHFSSKNLIGKGGCGRVYKGVFLDGKQVAVKVLKSSKQAWKDFSTEVNIMSSMRHKNIPPLLGVYIDNTELISVYDFMSEGSLEDHLHGNTLIDEKDQQQKCVLSWNTRFRVAVGVAEAVNYLHNGCSRPVIHRDIKSSNILLSEEFQPQLSDFGLAIWGPNSSSFETQTDIVGTFGYLAPEYVMYGKVSKKLDVYSFGVVLLELVSGRKPIDSSKGQESLLIWAKPILESGKLKDLVDPNLSHNYDESQMLRMALAARLCLTRTARVRPNISEIVRLLKGEERVDRWCDDHHNEEEDEEEDEYTNTHLSMALLDVEEEDDCTSGSSVEQRRSHGPCLEDFFKARCSH